ncbi:hypothetical protein VTK26DRAFT_7627 [Humicola hyalothermophila]
MAETSPPADGMESTWDEIEANYFASLRELHEQEDRELEAEYITKADDLKLEMIENHNSRAAILSQLQALNEQLNELTEQYAQKQAKLKDLKDQFDLEQAARNENRERLKEERRAFFNMYRRGGLAYRPAENGARKPHTAEPGPTESETATADHEKAQAGAHPVAQDQDQPEPSAAEENGTAEEKVPTDEQVHHSHELEQEPASVEAEMKDADPLKEAQAAVETGPANEHADSTDAMDGVEVNGGPELPEDVGGAPRTDQEAQSGTPPGDREANPEEPSTNPKTNGISITSEPSSQATIGKEAAVEAVAETITKPGSNRVVEEPMTDRPADVQESAGEPVTTPDATAPAKDDATNTTPAGKDTEMPDVPEQNENSVNVTKTADNVRPTTPTPASPTWSSELSSRDTTPELDSPVSLPGQDRPAARANVLTSGLIEVLDDSGGLIELIRPNIKDDQPIKRILEWPIKRPVKIRSSHEFSAGPVENLARPTATDARSSKRIGLYVQAKGDLQEQPCQSCLRNSGPFEGCVMVDDRDFPSCGNCEWNGHACQDADALGSESRNDRSTKKYAASSTPRAPGAGSGFAPANGASKSQEDEESDEDSEPIVSVSGSTVSKKAQRKSLPDRMIPRKSAGSPAPRKSLPSAGIPRKSTFGPPPPATPSTPATSNVPELPEINKEVLCLRDDGVVFTDPPIFRGVPLTKITTDHPYWEESWALIEDIVTPQLQKHQEKYEQLEASGAKQRDKHLANRDAKRGRLILRFLKEGDLHPYQLVGKEWITSKLTHYDTLYRMAHLLLEELPKMNLDVTPSQWLRHRIWEVSQEMGDKFNVGVWLGRAYHDPKMEQIRAKNGFQRVGRPPMHMMPKGSASKSSSSSKKAPPRPLKRKDPHSTPASPPNAAGNRPIKPSSARAVDSSASDSSDDDDDDAAVPINKSPTVTKSKIIKLKIPPGYRRNTSTDDTHQHHHHQQPAPKKIRLSTHNDWDQQQQQQQQQQQHSKTGGASSSTPRAFVGAPVDRDEDEGFTSRDSISLDGLTSIDFRVQQVKTRDIASNPGVTQYWHWLGPREGRYFEHQVLREVRPVQWSIFKDPYDFHLRMAEVGEVLYAGGEGKKGGKVGAAEEPDLRVVIREKKDGKGKGRGDVMALFRRGRTMRRFLAFLRAQGVKVVEISGEEMEEAWNEMDPETLPAGDSD